MSDNKTQAYKFWNGKNLNGGQEYYDINKEQQVNNSVELNMTISNETIAADDL